VKGVLPDHWIRSHADDIFVNGSFAETTREAIDHNTRRGYKVISYGLSSFGYDLRIDQKFKVFSPVSCQAIDPKNFNEACFEDVDTQGLPLLIPPNSFVLGQSMEELQIPEDVLCLVIGKSTYARCGIIVNVTPLEPGWRGHVTIEISNTASLRCRSLRYREYLSR